MNKISFYQTILDLTDKSICQLAEKCYHSNLKVVILVANNEIQERINRLLWTYSQKQFIPHGSKLDPLPEKQPIYITTELENPNNSKVLMLLNPEDIINFTQFERIIIVYDTPQVEVISKYKTACYEIESYKQNLNGTWKKET